MTQAKIALWCLTLQLVGCGQDTCAEYDIALEGCMLALGAPSGLPRDHRSACEGALRQPADFVYYQCLTEVYADECLDTPTDQRLKAAGDAVGACRERAYWGEPITLGDALTDRWGR